MRVVERKCLRQLQTGQVGGYPTSADRTSDVSQRGYCGDEAVITRIDPAVRQWVKRISYICDGITEYLSTASRLHMHALMYNGSVIPLAWRQARL